jgi:O-antigen ligase
MASITKTELETPPYISLQLIFGFCLLFGVLKAGTVAVTVVSILLCFWSLLGAKQSIQALSLVVVIKHLNPMLITLSGEFGIVSWITLLVAGLRLFATGSLRQFKLLGPLLVFVMVVVLLFTVQINKYPEVSAMKLFIFTYGSAALLVGYAALSDEEAEKLPIWFFSLFTAIVLLSLLTFAFPAIAYARNAAGFQGIMSHPQTFGPMLAPVASWLCAGIFFSKGDKLVRSLLFALTLIMLMVRSEARTGIVAVVLSVGTTFLVVFIQSKHFKSFRMGRFLTLAILAVALMGIVLISSTTIRDKLTGFVFKHHAKNMEQAVSSRSGGIASQWNFFKEKPLIGHGFGVYPSGEFPSEVVKVMGIPISAPVEKGFLPTAILEETGLTGALALLYFIASMGLRVSRNGDPRWLAVFFACIFINMGEMVFFSLGGIGLYFWLWLGLSTRIGLKSSLKPKRPYQAFVAIAPDGQIKRQTIP